jgi:hypothetical protein
MQIFSTELSLYSQDLLNAKIKQTTPAGLLLQRLGLILLTVSQFMPAHSLANAPALVASTFLITKVAR